MQALLPRHPVPALNVALVGGGRHVLGAAPGERFDLVVFYRGLHCPICAKYLMELERLAPEFAQRGVSHPCREQRRRGQGAADGGEGPGQGLALRLRPEPEKRAPVGALHQHSRGKTSIGIEEPALFSEPGVFLVRPDGTLYYGAVQTMPFARPSFQDLLGAIDFAIAKDYPARGEYTGEV
jgi:hypothetical protein